MGFADGLRELLGGFNAVRRIDQDGFDWREKDAQAELARGQQQAEWGQSNTAFQQGQEDRGMNLASDIIAGGGSDKDAASALPAGIGEAQRKALIAAALGKGKERQSYLRGQDAYNRRLLQGDKDAAAQGREEYKAEMRSKLMQEAEAIRQNQQMSPKDKEAALMRLEAQSALFDKAEAGRNSRFERGGSVRFALNPDGTYGMGYSSRAGVDGQPQTFEVPDALRGMRGTVPATQIEAGNIGAAQAGGLETIKGLFNPDWVGPIAGGIGYDVQAKIPGMPAPDEKRVRLTTAVSGLRNDVIKARTGAQMSEAEVPRLSEEIPLMTDKPEVFQAKLQITDARVQVMNAVRDGRLSKQEAIRIINQSTIDGSAPQIPTRQAAPSPAAPATPQPGSPQPTPQQGTVSFGGKQYRLRPGADPKLRSSYEEIR
jgi:hypothetical protein